MAGIEIDGVNNKIDFDDDKDTSISANVDDTLLVEVGGTDRVSFTSTGINLTQDGDSLKFGANSEVVLTHVHDQGLKMSHDGGGDPDLILANTASASDGNQLGTIFYNGQNSNGDEHTYAFILGQARDVTDGEEDGQLVFYGNKGGSDKQFINYGANANGASPTHEVCINEGSEDIDFRVESDGDANMLKIDAGNDCALFGTTGQSGGEKVSMRSTSAQKMLVVDNASDSLADQVIQIACKRSGVSSYNFLQCISDSHSSADSEFIFTGNGNGFADGTFSNNGADYAEFFETNDGNSIDVGKTVVFDGNKVRASTLSDDASAILGVVRPKVDGINSMIIGNTAWNSWTNKYLHDDYGRFIMEDYSVTEWVVKTYEDGTQQTESYETDKIPEDVIVPDNAVVKTQQRKKLNPDFDKDEEYKPRSERDEWVIIGMLGQIQVEKGQKTGDRWIKMRDISETVEEWLVR